MSAQPNDLIAQDVLWKNLVAQGTCWAVCTAHVPCCWVLVAPYARLSQPNHCMQSLHTMLMLLLVLQAGNLALAKQHYRRALQKCPRHFTTRTYLQLGECFMRSGDAVVAADMYTACIAAPPTPGTSASMAGLATPPLTVSCGDWVGLAVGSVVDRLVPGRCASMWLKLALAYVRLGDIRSAELALSEANLCDPEHPAVWGHLALLALQQVRRLGREAAF